MKCKKLVSMFLVVFMLVSIALIQTINVSADSSGTIYVSSYPDLVNMMKNPGGSYILLKDIEIITLIILVFKILAAFLTAMVIV